MHKVLSVLMIILLLGTFVSPLAAAEKHNLRLLTEASVDNVTLKPGKYQLTLDGEQLNILRKGKVLVEATIEIHPLEDGVPPNSVKVVKGELREIRLKKKCLMFT